MATNYNPKIVTDGLLMCLDASNPKSYPGSGSTWYDLSGNGYNGTFVGTISYTSGNGPNALFDWAASQTTDYVKFDVNSLQSLTDGFEWTIETILRLDNAVNTTYFHSMARAANNNHFIIQKGAGNYFPFNETLSNGTNSTFSAGEIIHLTFKHSGSIQYYYKNGVYRAYYTSANDLSLTEGWVLNQEQDSVLGNFDPNQATDMAVNLVRLYNRPLSDAEITQNFEATRGRFGI